MNVEGFRGAISQLRVRARRAYDEQLELVGLQCERTERLRQTSLEGKPERLEPPTQGWRGE